MRSPRDTQKSKVYKAEREVFAFGRSDEVWQPPEWFLDESTHQGAQAFVDEVSRSEFFCEHAPRAVTPNGHRPFTPRPLVVRDYQGRTTSHAGNFYVEHRGRWRAGLFIAEAHLGLRWLIVHELAHWCVPLGREAWHGPGFAYAYHQMVKRFLSEDSAANLYYAFQKHGVEASV